MPGVFTVDPSLGWVERMAWTFIREIGGEGAQTFFLSSDVKTCSYSIIVLHQLCLVMWVENGFAFGMVRPTVAPSMGLLI